MPTDEFCSDNFWDVKEALVVQNAVDIIPTFWIFCPSLPSLLVFSLQFVKSQSHAANIIKPVIGQLFL